MGSRVRKYKETHSLTNLSTTYLIMSGELTIHYVYIKTIISTMGPLQGMVFFHSYLQLLTLYTFNYYVH